MEAIDWSWKLIPLLSFDVWTSYLDFASTSIDFYIYFHILIFIIYFFVYELHKQKDIVDFMIDYRSLKWSHDIEQNVVSFFMPTKCLMEVSLLQNEANATV